MSAFSADWLALREPYDRAARNASVLQAVASHFASQRAILAVDLACGTGSTVRAIAPRLPPRQNWRLVDNNLSFLARASDVAKPPEIMVSTRPVDLSRDLELALEGPLDLVTTSALLDLVSADWLERFAVETAVRWLPVYAAFTYDGRVNLEPHVRFDREVMAGFNMHQGTDKGFGPALGPAAAARAVTQFERCGYSVVQGRSDWIFESDDNAIQDALFQSWAELASLTTQMTEREITGWLTQRRAHLARRHSRLQIGHIDIFAVPTTTR